MQPHVLRRPRILAARTPEGSPAPRAGAAAGHAELERLRDAAIATRAGVWDYRIDTDVLECSDRWYEILGLDPSRPVRSIEEFKRHIHPDDVAGATEVDLATLADLVANEQNYQVQFRIVRPSGEVRRVRSVACLLPGPTGVPNRAVGFMADITDEDPAHAMDAVGKRVGGIAHDLANALQTVEMPLALIPVLAREGRVGEVAQLVAVARASVRHATGVARRLLDLFRARPRDPAMLDVAATVDAFAAVMRGLVGGRIAIRVACAEAWPVVADSNELESVLLNLCINARDAMPDGGEISVDVANCSLDSAAAARLGLRPGDYVRITLADPGAGMSEDTLEHATEPYFTGKTAGQGSGLGLFMAANFARSAGGQIRLASKEGEGTAVSLFMPRG